MAKALFGQNQLSLPGLSQPVQLAAKRDPNLVAALAEVLKGNNFGSQVFGLRRRGLGIVCLLQIGLVGHGIICKGSF